MSIDGHPFSLDIGRQAFNLKTNSLGTLWHLATSYRRKLDSLSQRPEWSLLGKAKVRVFFLGGLVYSRTLS
jgi:hypothetical protein